MQAVTAIVVGALLCTCAGMAAEPSGSVPEPLATVASIAAAPPAREDTTKGLRLVAHVEGRSERSADQQSEVLPAYEAESSTRLTLDELEAIAFQHNPTLSAAAARMNAARGRRLQAGLYPNPVAGYHATEIGVRGTAGQQGGFISQRFITGGKLQLDQAIAAKEIGEAHARFHAQEQRVLSDVRVRFYDALVAQRRVELTSELAQIGDALVQATDKLVEGRLGSENDLLQAEIRADESQILADNALSDERRAWRRLVAVIGVPTLQRAELAGDLDTIPASVDWNTCYAYVLSCNPELHAARANLERAVLAIRRAKREPIPNVELAVSVRHHNFTQDDVANVQVGVPIPIFNKNQGNIRAAEAEWVAACNEVKRVELRLQDRLAVAYGRLVKARQQASRYRERIVPRADQSLQLVTDAYQKGQVKYLTLLTAQQTYVQVNLSYLDALQALWAAVSVIDGQLLTDSLEKGP